MSKLVAAAALLSLDGDRRADAAVILPGAGGLRVLRSTGSALGPPASLPVTGAALAAADLDRDGDVDLLVAREAPGALLFLRNLGDGRLASPVALASGGAPRRLAVADLDGDAWPDGAAHEADGSISVWMNRGR